MTVSTTSNAIYVLNDGCGLERGISASMSGARLNAQDGNEKSDKLLLELISKSNTGF